MVLLKPLVSMVAPPAKAPTAPLTKTRLVPVPEGVKAGSSVVEEVAALRVPPLKLT